jgi:signal transduction histidine kinase
MSKVTLCSNNGRIFSWSLRVMDSIGLDLEGTIVFMTGHRQQTSRFSLYGLFTRRKSQAMEAAAEMKAQRSAKEIESLECTSVPNISEGLLAYAEEQTYLREHAILTKGNIHIMGAAQKQIDTLGLEIALKKEFIAAVAHELRSPLSVVHSGVELLRKELKVVDEPEIHDTLEDMSTACQTCLDTVGDFLAYDKLSSNKFSLEMTPLLFFHSVLRVVRPFTTQARSTGVQLTCTDQGLGAYLLVAADEFKLNQVVRNLVSNAVKFSPPGGCVAVSVRGVERGENELWARLEVRDEGPGISAINQTRLFKDVMQIEPGRLQGGGGSGLGLFISRRIVDLHGGNIGVFSQGEGHGCTFFIELPVVAVQNDASASPTPAMAPSETKQDDTIVEYGIIVTPTLYPCEYL